jgi:hypothetical protein
VRGTKETDSAKSGDHISKRRLRDVADEHSILTMDELEHLAHCGLCIDCFVDLVQFLVENKLRRNCA